MKICLNRALAFIYTTAGLLLRIVNPSGGGTRIPYHYNHLGRLVERQDTLRNSTQFFYADMEFHYGPDKEMTSSSNSPRYGIFYIDRGVKNGRAIALETCSGVEKSDMRSLICKRHGGNSIVWLLRKSLQ